MAVTFDFVGNADNLINVTRTVASAMGSVSNSSKDTAKSFSVTASATDALKGGLSKLADTFLNLDDKVKAVGQKLTTHVSLPMMGMGALFLREFGDGEKALYQTEAALKSTGNQANVTSEQITDFASEMARLTGIDDEVVQGGENLMLTFTSVKNTVGEGNDIFTQANKAALDMSVTFSEDVSSASIQLGKALNDPIAGVTSLKRIGIQLTDVEKEQIKALMEHGNVLGAQKIILKEVTTQVGGAAEAYGKTLPGELSKAKNALMDAGASTMSIFVPPIKLAAEAVTKLAGLFQTLPEPVRMVVGGLAGLAIAIGPLIVLGSKFISGWMLLGSALERFGGSVGGVGTKISEFAKQTSTVGIVQNAAGIAVRKFGDSIMSLGANLAGFAAKGLGLIAVVMLIKELGDYLASGRFGKPADVDRLALSIEQLATKGKLLGVLAERWDDYQKAVDRVIKANEHPLKYVNAWVDDLRNGSLDEARKMVDQLDTSITTLLRNNPSSAAGTWENFKTQLINMGIPAEKINELFPKATGAIKDMGTTSEDAANKIADINKEIAALMDPLFNAWNALTKNKQAQDDATAATGALYMATMHYNDVLERTGPNSKETADAYAALTDAEKKNNDAQLAVGQSALTTEAAMYTLRDGLDKQSISVDQARGRLNEWVAQGLLTQDQARQVAEKLGIVAYTAGTVPTSIHTDVTADTGQAIWQFQRLSDAIWSAVNGKIALGTQVQVNGQDYVMRGPGLALNAEGGPVYAGVASIVGEKGAEIFVPSTDGFILPNDLLHSIATSVTAPSMPSHAWDLPSSGGNAPNINITAQTNADPHSIAGEVAWVLRTNGR